MRTMLKIMKMPKNEIPEDKVKIFEQIIKKYYVPNSGSNEGDNKFMEALNEHLTEEQRFKLWEQNGGCRGFSKEKERKAFALENADKPIRKRLELYLKQYKKTFDSKTLDFILDDKNKTIAVTFACAGCYENSLKGKFTAPFKIYYEHCAGGRLDNLQTALGINLRIKSVDIPSAGVNNENPCVFLFEIVK